jgi:hypothetical protein
MRNAINATYTNGKLVFEYPQWMLYGVLPAQPRAAPVTEQYELYNPKNIELVEGARYKVVLIPFDDGDAAEIIEQIQDTK